VVPALRCTGVAELHEHAGGGRYNQSMSDDDSSAIESQRTNQFDRAQQRAARKGFAFDAGRAIQQQLYGPGPICEAPGGCTNLGGAFTSERDGRIYEFCSEGCRAEFERASR
jgi:YHS domain-containing protein